MRCKESCWGELLNQRIMETKEKIAVMQAFEDRKTIQYKKQFSTKWYDWLHWD